MIPMATSSRLRSDTGYSVGRLAQGVADQPDGVDDRGSGRLELLAQVAHVGLDHVAVSAEVVVPHVVEDLGLRQHVARVEEEETEQVELGRGQRDRLAGPRCTSWAFSSISMSAKRRIPLVLGLAPDPPEDGVHPGDDLGEGEGLGHVVVAADGQAGHLVLDGVAGGEEEDRVPGCRRTAGAG